MIQMLIRWLSLLAPKSWSEGGIENYENDINDIYLLSHRYNTWPILKISLLKSENKLA